MLSQAFFFFLCQCLEMLFWCICSSDVKCSDLFLWLKGAMQIIFPFLALCLRKERNQNHNQRSGSQTKQLHDCNKKEKTGAVPEALSVTVSSTTSCLTASCFINSCLE